ncbi:ABC transporter ATP-binding protein [Curtobacterium sp. MCLR17_007]|uniref:ABC transporter ATP-binding protein n=1 Tax=Curtobacterium sp. MCLR17_007 TaxID=2175648 RepID=UPI000DA8B4AE|nr:ABC transporter ATP-binding protein [Curtobacterium sp. MCLR17_007]WIB61913.1 ABC transporter ATP-binding protein [Curtobacterium sp. MCLR17_007]
MTAPVLDASGVGFDVVTGAGTLRVLHDVDLRADRGELVVVRGASGSGKSSLLRLFAGLERPTRGTVALDGTDLSTQGDDELRALRRDRLAIVFQDFALLPVLTAAENVEVPLRIRRTDPVQRDAAVADALARVGLSGHEHQRPDELSGGQQQRVGIARAVVGRPGLLLADEPTAQLDSATAAGIVDLVVDLVEHTGLAAVVTTSDDAFVDRATRVVEIAR